MFKKNIKHQQPALISTAGELLEKQRKGLENSWNVSSLKTFTRSFCAALPGQK